MKKTLSILAAAAFVASIAVTAQAAVVYGDNFNRNGNLDGTSPSVVNTGGATWSDDYGAGRWVTSTTGGGIATTTNTYANAWLPINSGAYPVLDGNSDFTLSINFNPLATPVDGSEFCLIINSTLETYGALIKLNVRNSGGTLQSHWEYNGGNPGPYASDTVNQYPASNPTVFSITYNAAASTLSFAIGGVTFNNATMTGVPLAQIAAINKIGIREQNDINAFGVSNFKLEVGAVPEPSTYVMLLSGIGTLLGVRKFRSRKS